MRPPVQSRNDQFTQDVDQKKLGSSHTSTVTAQGHGKLNISLKGIQDLDENQIINEELLYYDASRVFGINGNEIVREINLKKKIVVSKIVYSNGMYNKFTIVARCYRTAQNEITMLQNIYGISKDESKKTEGAVYKTSNPVFQLTGICEDMSINFHPTTLYFNELESIMKILMAKEVLPASRPISHIRSFEHVCQYLLFPFMKLYMPKESHEDQS